jgi:hypothetical protein
MILEETCCEVNIEKSVEMIVFEREFYDDWGKP